MTDKPEIFVNIAPVLAWKSDEWVNVWQIISLHVEKGRRDYKNSRREEWKYKKLLEAADREKNFLKRIWINHKAWVNKPMFFYSSVFYKPRVVISFVGNRTFSVSFRSNKDAEKGYRILRSMLITPYEAKKNVDD